MSKAHRYIAMNGYGPMQKAGGAGGPSLGAGFAMGDSNMTGDFCGCSPWPARLSKTVSNFASNGNRLANVDADVDGKLALKAWEFALFGVGINDITIAVADPNTAMRASAQSIVDKCQAAGVTSIIFSTLAPFKNHSDWNADRQTWTDSFNTWLTGTFGPAEAIDILDVYTLLENTSFPGHLDELSPEYEHSILGELQTNNDFSTSDTSSGGGAAGWDWSTTQWEISSGTLNHNSGIGAIVSSADVDLSGNIGSLVRSTHTILNEVLIATTLSGGSLETAVGGPYLNYVTITDPSPSANTISFTGGFAPPGDSIDNVTINIVDGIHYSTTAHADVATLADPLLP